MILIFFFVRIRGRDVMRKRIEVAVNGRFLFFFSLYCRNQSGFVCLISQEP